jgi:alkanesulfonate monooxygenase SsuD/methylene tetrahydromethanopterin reductase-like flavin-dependent oxidoreductase (luciferase family)
VGQQNFEMDEMRALWRWLDASGFDWISAWDHIYEAPHAGGTQPHFEAVATLAALALETTNARLGCLVFYVGYRNPGLLAKAAITIDHLANGRFELGIGAGWHQWEAEAYGYDFPSVGKRLDMLEEATQVIGPMINASRFPDEVHPENGERPEDEAEPRRTSFRGTYVRADDASCLPQPTYGSMPLWFGGLGEKRTLPMVARYADGWNAAYVSADEFARKSQILDRYCGEIGRDPEEIERSVNLSFSLAVDQRRADELAASITEQWGPQAERIRAGSLLGTPEQAVEQVMAYAEAGADMVNIALRAPFDEEALAAYQEVVMAGVGAESSAKTPKGGS